MARQRPSNRGKTMIDIINQPPHYTEHPSKIECIEITRHLDFNRGCAIKYLWRCGKKDSVNQELKKAIWYLNDEINNGFGDVNYSFNTNNKITDKLDTLALYQTDQERKLFNLIIFGAHRHLQQAIKIIEGMCDE